jgi:hypothetical protein
MGEGGREGGREGRREEGRDGGREGKRKTEVVGVDGIFEERVKEDPDCIWGLGNSIFYRHEHLRWHSGFRV